MIKRTLWLAAGAAFAYGAYRTLWQQRPLQNVPAPRSIDSYDEAIAAASAQIAEREDGMRADCAAQLLTHGHKTDRAIVLLHGFTNCPRQFQSLAELYHARGYNVFVPRFPHHGLYNRAPRELADLTSEDLVRTGMAAVDIAHGLGHHVTVFGFSMGGLVAAWLAQNRADIDRVVMLAPALAVRTVPFALMPLYATYVQRTRNRFVWWDPVTKAQNAVLEHAYYGFYSRSFGALLRLAVLVGEQAQIAAPKARSLVVAVNPTDESIDNDGVLAVARRWRRRGANVTIHEIPSDWQLIHDLVDPGQPAQQIDRVYPLLVKWSEYPYYVAEPIAA